MFSLFGCSGFMHLLCTIHGVTESTIIATIHCPDIGYCLFRNPLVTHIPYYLPCIFLILIVSYWVVLSLVRVSAPLASCTLLGYISRKTIYVQTDCVCPMRPVCPDRPPDVFSHPMRQVPPNAHIPPPMHPVRLLRPPSVLTHPSSFPSSTALV